MIGWVAVRPVIEGKEGVVGFPELGYDVDKALLQGAPPLLVFTV